MSLSRTAAIVEARKHVTLSAHGAQQYVVYHPHKFSNLAGPNTCGQPRDYAQARVVYTRTVADLALYLMGFDGSGIEDGFARDDAIERAQLDGWGKVEDIVRVAAERLREKV